MNENRRPMRKPVAGTPSLGWFDDSFGGRIGAGDVDMLVERNGQFLVGEFKNDGANELSTGQFLTLSKLAALGNFTVFVIDGEPGTNDSPPTIRRVRRVAGNQTDEPVWRDCDFAGFCDVLREWFAWANQRPR